jgi:succinate-semialdehyde dehydrogenase/glutarate-semialdehyde dehydrogenase
METAESRPYPRLRMLVDNRWIDRGGGGATEVFNPATAQPLAQLPLAGPDELQHALQSAWRGYLSWKAATPLERQGIIGAATRLIRERARSIARVLTLEQGKPLAESHREVVLAADIIDFLAEEGKRLYGRVVPARIPGVLGQVVQRVPVGPVAAFTPWNFPANLPSRKIGGALAAGCSVIIKPAETTPGTCLELVRAFVDAGLPAGVLNLVYGDPGLVSETLAASPLIAMISLTGSIEVGRRLGALAAQGMKRYTAELGGHAPVIVCSDADAAASAKLSATAKFRNAGQVCTAPTRFFVQRAQFPAFLESMAAAAKSLRAGDGLEPEVDFGPLAHLRRIGAMEEFIRDAVSKGARVVTGGARMNRAGWFFEPTILADVPGDAEVMRREPFGRIAVVNAFDDIDQAVREANSLPYALAAYAFTRDLALAHKLSEQLEAGMVGINHFGISQPETPFGGLKQSGYGSESGAEGLLGYTDVKFVSTAAA